MRYLVAQVAALAMCVIAPAAALTVTNVEINTSSQYRAFAHDAVDKVNHYVVGGEYQLTVKDAKGVHIEDAFCDDFFHTMTVGAQSPSITYHLGTLTTDGRGNPLSTDAARLIGGYAHLAVGLTDLSKLAALQYVIWHVEYPGLGYTSFNSPTVQADYEYYLVHPVYSRNPPRTYVSDDTSRSQGVIPIIGGVPEPASWALMLAGFGLIGVARRRHTRTVLA